MNRKIKCGLAGMTFSLVLLAGCQKNPDTSIISNKDFDKMIEQAENTEGQTTEVSELADKYDEYKTTIKDDTMNVEVNVDAKVDIPKTDKLSIYRVKQQTISQEFLDKVRTTLAEDVSLYDGAVLGVETKQTIESEINMWKEIIKDVQNDNNLTEEDKQVCIDEYQAQIDSLQGRYEQAVDEIPLTDYPSDYQLHSVSTLYQEHSSNNYYEWQHELNSTGDIYYGVSDAGDGIYTFLYAQNNENYGNRLHYRRNRVGYPYGTPVVGSSGFDGSHMDYSDLVWEFGTEPKADILEDNPRELVEDKQESCDLTEDDARGQAEALLITLGLGDYTYYTGGLYNELLSCYGNNEDVFKYKKEYIFGFRRNINGVFACNEGQGKLTDGYQGDTYVKKMWDGEGVTIIVNDSGIVGFDLCLPLTITETVVEQATLKSFEEVKDIFEQMIVTINASQDDELPAVFDINRVVLRYTRISEPDSFDTGLLIPTWEFIGTINGVSKGLYYDGTVDDMVVMSINAVDGSVINQELGY